MGQGLRLSARRRKLEHSDGRAAENSVGQRVEASLWQRRSRAPRESVSMDGKKEVDTCGFLDIRYRLQWPCRWLTLVRNAHIIQEF